MQSIIDAIHRILVNYRIMSVPYIWNFISKQIEIFFEINKT